MHSNLHKKMHKNTCFMAIFIIFANIETNVENTMCCLFIFKYSKFTT